MATVGMTRFCVKAETIATNMVMPAEGPSLGVAPSGTWMWMLLFSTFSISTPKWSALDLRYSNAKVADSFITSPRLPVMVSVPLPLLMLDSIKSISPPTWVQARPVTTPTLGSLPRRSLLWMGRPSISFSSEAWMVLLIFCPSANCTARRRIILAIVFSNWRTPLSRV